MRSLLGRLLGDRRGASAAEFAMVAGPLLLLVAGSVEFGRVYWAKQVLYETATAGARCMALPETGCSEANAYNAGKAKTFIAEFAAARGITLVAGNITVDRAATCAGVAGFSKVEVSTIFETPLPLLASFLHETPLAAEACFPTYSS
jgi:Flp pilus assembly protein TadG